VIKLICDKIKESDFLMNIRTTEDVRNEKNEDRGWHQGYEIGSKKNYPDSIPPLPLSEAEYHTMALLVSKIAIQDESEQYASIYFDLQRRATYGNRFSQPQGMEEVERVMWSLGSTSKNTENIEVANEIRTPKAY